MIHWIHLSVSKFLDRFKSLRILGSLTLDFKVDLPRYSGFKHLQFFKFFSILDFVFMAFRFFSLGWKVSGSCGFFRVFVCLKMVRLSVWFDVKGLKVEGLVMFMCKVKFSGLGFYIFGSWGWS